jgi:hypothetical protein
MSFVHYEKKETNQPYSGGEDKNQYFIINLNECLNKIDESNMPKKDIKKKEKDIPQGGME